MIGDALQKICYDLFCLFTKSIPFMGKYLFAALLFVGVCVWPPVSMYAAAPVSSHAVSTLIDEKTTGNTSRKIRKIKRLQIKFFKKLERYSYRASAEYWLWMGLFALGLALALTIISATLAGIVAAAGLACLFIWGFFKLGAL